MSREEILPEIATSVGQTFLGITVNCWGCHNHKFDPILQADYDRPQAIFGGAKERGGDRGSCGEGSGGSGG